MKNIFFVLLLLLVVVPVHGKVELVSTLDDAYSSGIVFEHGGNLYQFWTQDGLTFLLKFSFDGTLIENITFDLDFGFGALAGEKLDSGLYLLGNKTTLFWLENGTIVHQLDLLITDWISAISVQGPLIYAFSRYWKVNVINSTSEEQWIIELDKDALPSGSKVAATSNGTHFFTVHAPFAASRGRTLAERIALFDGNGKLVEEYDAPSDLRKTVSLIVHEGDLYSYYDSGLYLITLEPMTRVFKLFSPIAPLALSILLLVRGRKMVSS